MRKAELSEEDKALVLELLKDKHQMSIRVKELNAELADLRMRMSHISQPSLARKFEVGLDAIRNVSRQLGKNDE